MFEELSGRLTGVLRRLTGSGRLSEENIREAMREVRRALLEADVHYKVARDLVRAVEERAVGQEVLRSITPGQQVVRIVHEELVRTLGGQSERFDLPSGRPPHVVMLVGLQGVGKTTLAAKLGHWFARRGMRPLLVAADTVRPAAALQLETLAAKAGVAFTRGDEARAPGTARPPGSVPAPAALTPLKVVERSLVEARQGSFDPVILDTQGRLHVDDALMEELALLQQTFSPAETLLIVDAMVGQDAVRSAEAFKARLALGGAVLTKLDGDARGGAALSLAAATGLRVRLVSVGEGLESLEVFHPERMASRILGMGDVLTLVERAQEVVDLDEARQTAERVRAEGFTLNDFRDQLRQVRKLGPVRELMGMIPGASRLALDENLDEDQLVKAEAILDSMTVEERLHPQILNAGRRRRIARGSGTTVEEVNQLVRDFEGMDGMMRSMGFTGRRKRSSRGPWKLRGR